MVGFLLVVYHFPTPLLKAHLFPRLAVSGEGFGASINVAFHRWYRTEP